MFERFRRSRTPEPPAEPAPDPRAAAPGALPPDGPATVAGVPLPHGEVGRDEAGDAVVWWTGTPPDDPAGTWAALAAAFEQTGLWPVLLDGERFDLIDPPAPAGPDAEAVLRRGWHEATEGDGDPDHDAWVAEHLAPVGATFPGLAGAGATWRPAVAGVTGGFDAGGLLLVPVVRPADVPAAIGWSGACNYDLTAADVSAVLRSWEDRYDAVVVGIGLDLLHLAVRRPPEGDDVVRVAAEQYALCLDIVDQGVGDLAALVAGLRTTTAWSFWWD